MAYLIIIVIAFWKCPKQSGSIQTRSHSHQVWDDQMRVCACTHITVINIDFFCMFYNLCMYKNHWKVYFLDLCKGLNKLISTRLVHWNVWKYSDHVLCINAMWYLGDKYNVQPCLFFQIKFVLKILLVLRLVDLTFEGLTNLFRKNEHEFQQMPGAAKVIQRSALWYKLYDNIFICSNYFF